MIAFVIAMFMGVAIGMVVAKATDWILGDGEDDIDEESYKVHNPEE